MQPINLNQAGFVTQFHPQFNKFYIPITHRVAQPITVNVNSEIIVPDFSIGNGSYLKYIQLNCFVNGTNNGTNYWTFQFQQLSTIAGSNNITSFNTSTNVGGAWLRFNQACNFFLDLGTYMIEATFSQTGAPGQLFIHGMGQFAMV